MAIWIASAEVKARRRRQHLPLPVLLLCIAGLVLVQFDGEWHGMKESIQNYIRQSVLSDALLSSSSSSNNNSTANTRAAAARDDLTTTTTIDCKTLRGTSGRWVQDWDVANQTHYKIPKTFNNWHIAEQEFVPTSAEPYRWATSWRWQDDYCPVEILSPKNIDNFCDVIWELDIRRFLIVGDSLSHQFGYSFMSLLGHAPARPKFPGMFKPFGLSCPAAEIEQNTTNTTTVRPAFGFTLWMVRRSPIQDLLMMCETAQANTTTTKTWDAAYRKFVLSDNQHKTAILFNTGAWIQEGLDEYKTGFGCMVDWIDSIPRQQGVNTSNILAFFRPTNRPNFDCLPRKNNDANMTQQEQQQSVRQIPHATLEEYYRVAQEATKNDSIVREGATTFKTADGVTFSKNWEYIEAYNEYSRDYLEARRLKQQDNANTSNASAVPIYWINTYNSTALRRDGHLAYGDCLHYSLPGPIDWWSHLFFSLLADLARERLERRGNAIAISKIE